MQGIAVTSLWVAAARARETDRKGGLFRDPFARKLAGDEGEETFALARAHNPMDVPTIEIRTRWLDDRIAEATARNIRQVVILAAGMDARAYRLAWPAGTTLYELDRDFVLAYKAERIAGAEPTCKRVPIAVDLRDDWLAALDQAGFDRNTPTLFLIEGLLVYLEAADVKGLFARVDSIAAKGSVILFDVVGESLLQSPFMAQTLEMMKHIDALWRFGTDEPEKLLSARWQPRVDSMADVGASFGRWPFPLAPRGTPGVPQSFLVVAVS
jgi:methyltransferase (TIGR00027 family)